MSNVIQQIPISEIKQYIATSKACTISDSCTLDKYGLLALDFSTVVNASECSLQIRRKSGNGLVTVVSGSQAKDQTIASKSSQYLNIDISGEQKKIEVRRPARSNGIIEILGITLHGNKTSEDIVTTNWNSVLKRCKSYRSIRLTDNKLFAAEGAVLEAETIVSISTNPPNAFVIKHNKLVKFVISCEIIHLEVTQEPGVSNKILYPHVEGSPKITHQHQSHTAPPINSPQNTHKHHDTPETPSPTMKILYDSGHGNFKRATLSPNQSAKLSPNGNGIQLGRKGSISIPISSIQPDREYVVAIEMHKINGNGKVMSYIDPNASGKTAMVFATPHRKNVNMSVRSSPTSPPQGHSFRFVVTRPDSATGDIVISRIMLLEGLNIPVTQASATITHKVAHSNILSSWDFYESTEHLEIIENDIVKAQGEYQMSTNENPKFVIVIPSYKNSAWVEKNITSALDQKYEHYRIIFVDDCSPDDTFSKAQKIIEERKQVDKVTLVRNTERKGALQNLYESIHSCDDNEIIVTLDGDDWFAHDKVLNKLYDRYINSDVWMTYGQYKSYPDNGAGCSQQIPTHIIKHNMYRQYRWCSSHLRTFYAWLFKKIKKEDLLDKNGKYYTMAWDLGFQMPMLEMSGYHSKFIPDVLYIYNVENPINDSKVNIKLQQDTEREIRRKPKYNKL